MAGDLGRILDRVACEVGPVRAGRHSRVVAGSRSRGRTGALTDSRTGVAYGGCPGRKRRMSLADRYTAGLGFRPGRPTWPGAAGMLMTAVRLGALVRGGPWQWRPARSGPGQGRKGKRALMSTSKKKKKNKRQAPVRRQSMRSGTRGWVQLGHRRGRLVLHRVRQTMIV